MRTCTGASQGGEPGFAQIVALFQLRAVQRLHERRIAFNQKLLSLEHSALGVERNAEQCIEPVAALTRGILRRLVRRVKRGIGTADVAPRLGAGAGRQKNGEAIAASWKRSRGPDAGSTACASTINSGSASGGRRVMPTTSKSRTTTRASVTLLVQRRLPTHRPPTHPGAILLKDFLKPFAISQSAFAIQLGVSFP